MSHRTRLLLMPILALAFAAPSAASAQSPPPVPPCTDQASCEAFFAEYFGCNSIESCQENPPEVPPGGGGGGGEDPPSGEPAFPPCDSQESCQALFESMLPAPPGGAPAFPPCDSQESCQAWFMSTFPVPNPPGGGGGDPPPSGGSNPPPPSGGSGSGGSASAPTSGSSTTSEPAPAAEQPAAPRRVALRRSCRGGRVQVQLTGKDARLARSVRFSLGKRALRTDYGAPYTATLPRSAKGTVRALVRFANKSTRTLNVRVGRC